MAWLLPIAEALPAATSLALVAAAEMPDQHGGRDSLAAHSGSEVMVLIVDARRLGAVRPWAEDLAKRCNALHFLTVADVNERQPVTEERVAAVLRRRVPEDVAVLIDMNRVWARELSLDTAEPNLVLVAPDGALVARFHGRWSAERAEPVVRACSRASP